MYVEVNREGRCYPRILVSSFGSAVTFNILTFGYMFIRLHFTIKNDNGGLLISLVMFVALKSVLSGD
jgi:hypothetical protein